MDIADKKLDNVNVLSLSGRLDAYSATEVEKKLDSLIESGQNRLVINLEKLEYISSSGLRVFLAALKKAKKGQGDIKLACMKPFIKEVFDIAGFSQLFNIFDNQDAAVSGFSQA
ncbi:MAG TPA: STAS domain-containing protein [Dehalococcoidia bacterium]|jgi:anti-sigma B factor antagonist